MFTGSLVEIEYTLNFHPLTYPYLNDILSVFIDQDKGALVMYEVAIVLFVIQSASLLIKINM